MTVSILVTYDIQSATGQLSSGAATNQIKAGNTLLNFASGSPLVQNFPTVNSLGPLSNDGAGNLSYTVLTASKLYGCNQSGMLSPINVGTNLSLVGSTLSAAGGSGSIQLTGDVTSPLSSGTVPTTFADITAYSVLANSTGSSGAPTAFAVADTTLLGGEDGTGALINVTLGANLSMVSGVLSAAGASGAVTLTGAVTGTGTGSVATVFGNIGANTVLANATAGSAAPTPITLTASQLLGRGSTGNIAAIAPDGSTCAIVGTQLQVLGAPATGTAGGNLSGTYPNPNVIALKTASGSVTVGSATAPTAGQILTAINSTSASWQTPSLPGTGTVTSVSVTSANGVSGTVATPTTTPAITLSLAAITPTSVNGVVLGGASTPSLTVTGTSSISGSNTGDQFTNLAANSVLANNTVSAALPVGIALSASTFIGRGSTGNVVALAPDGSTCAIVGSQLQVLGAPPSGSAGGDLTGTYPNPTIGANKVTYAKFQAASTGNVVLANPTGSAANYQEVGLVASRLLGRGSTGNIAPIAPDNLTCQIVGTTLSVITAPPTGTAGGDLVGTYPNPSVIALSNTSTSVAIGGAAAPSAGQVLTAINSMSAQWQTPSTPGTGTVTSVSVTTANGVSGTVATATTTPAITLSLGAITPSSVNSIVLSGSSTPSLTVTGTSSISGVNTGDQFTALSPNSVLANDTTSAGLPGAVVLANNQLLGRGISGNNIGAISLSSSITMGGGTTLTVTGAPPTGVAGGDLGAVGSTYPNPVIKNNVVTYAKIQQSNAGNAVMCNATSGIGNFGEVDLPNFQQLLGRGQSGNLAAISLGTGLFMTLNTLNVAGDSLMQPTVIGSTFGYEDNANHNTGIGYQVLNSLTSGQFNVAMGDSCCIDLTSGNDNMAIGYAALSRETTGFHTTALGSTALINQRGGSLNTAIGSTCLAGTSTGLRNVGIGYAAGNQQTTGTDNTYIGQAAGVSISTAANCVFIGSGCNTSVPAANNQIAIGSGAVTSAANQVAFPTATDAIKAIGIVNIETSVLNTGTPHNYYVIQDSSGNWGTTPYASSAAQMQPTVLGTAYGYIDNSLSNYAVGYQCLGNSHALTGNFNTSIGTTTLISLTTGAQNTCGGYGSMYEETTGVCNSVFGTASLSSSHGNTYNTAMGAYILTAGTGCSANSAVGFQALQHTQSNNNAAIGANAGQALTSGSNCTFLGEGTDTSVPTASNQIAIGSGAVSTAGGQIAFPMASTHLIANGLTNISTNILNTSTTPSYVVVQDSGGNWGAVPTGGGGGGFAGVLYTSSTGNHCSNTLTTLDSFTVPADTFSAVGDALMISAQFSASTSAANEEADCYLFINSSNFSDSTAAVQDFGSLEPFYIVMEATLTYTVSGWLLISGIYTKCLMHPSSTSGAVTLVASGFNFWTAFNKTSAFTINIKADTLTSNGSITSQGVSIIFV